MQNSYKLLRFKDETESYIKTLVSEEIGVTVNFSEKGDDELAVRFSLGNIHAESYIKINLIKEITSELWKRLLICPLLFDLAKEKWLKR